MRGGLWDRFLLYSNGTADSNRSLHSQENTFVVKFTKKTIYCTCTYTEHQLLTYMSWIQRHLTLTSSRCSQGQVILSDPDYLIHRPQISQTCRPNFIKLLEIHGKKFWKVWKRRYAVIGAYATFATFTVLICDPFKTMLTGVNVKYTLVPVLKIAQSSKNRWCY